MVAGRGILEECFLSSYVVDKGGYPYLVNPVSDGVPAVTKELLDDIVDRFVDVCDFECDYILAPEAMGIHLATAVCMRTGIPFLVIRKREYGLPGEVALKKKTGYGDSTMYVNGIGEGDRVVLLDDVISTGGTTRSIIEAIEKTGADVVGVVTVFNKSRDIKALEETVGKPIRSILNIGVLDGRPVVYP